MQNNNSKLNTILLIILIILVAAGIFLMLSKKTPSENSIQVSQQENVPISEQQEVPKGSIIDENSYVPSKPQTTSSNSFAPLATTYITAQNWPPKISKTTEPATCPGIPGPRVINGKSYCVDMRMEGAAGSIFTDFIYSTGTTQVTFTLRFSRCDNYDDPQKTACEIERAKFNPDQIIIDANL